MYINNLGHMTKMAAMPIYGKNPSKIIESGGVVVERRTPNLEVLGSNPTSVTVLGP